MFFLPSVLKIMVNEVKKNRLSPNHSVDVRPTDAKPSLSD
jgi:hypothetical protein